MVELERITPTDEVGRIVQEELSCDFSPGFILYGKEKTCLGVEFPKFAEEIKAFKVRDEDIWVCSYPKTGSTWVNEMVWLIANDLDYKGVQSELMRRIHFLEWSTLFDLQKYTTLVNLPNEMYITDRIKYTAAQSSPRVIKTHLPYYLLPDQIVNKTRNPKIIYIWRNPKDVCVSYLHHGNLVEGWRTNLENFAKVFLADKVRYGSFWKHVFGYWNQRYVHNILIITYEEMKSDLPQVIKKVTHFLEKDITGEEIKTLCDHLSFESMQKNPYVNKQEATDGIKKKLNVQNKDGTFMRAGKVGKYKEELTPEVIEKFNEWIKENIAGTDLGKAYDYSL